MAKTPYIEKPGDTIVADTIRQLLGSYWTSYAQHRMAAYNAAKIGVINLTRSLAVDYGPAGVRANVVAPGPVRTPALESLLARENRLLDQ